MSDVKPALTPAADEPEEASRDGLEPGVSYAPRAGMIARTSGSRAMPALGAGHHAGYQKGEIGEIAPIQRQVVDLLLHDHVALNGAVPC